MTYLCSIFVIFVASVDPLSKNKSRIIIQKCRNFCKQLTLPGWTVQQLPFFKTVRLYTVVNQSPQCNGEDDKHAHGFASLVKVPPYSKLNFQGKIFFTQNWCNITLIKDQYVK